MSSTSEIWDWSKTICFASARCRHKHESRSCETLDVLQVADCRKNINHGAANKRDDLQVLVFATSINQGTATRWMIYKCSMSHQASIMELRKTG
jgi:hypothetical protein